MTDTREDEYHEETYTDISTRLQREYSPPTKEEVEILFAKYPKLHAGTYNYGDYEWTENHWNGVAEIIRPEDREKQHGYFRRAIDTVLKDRLNEFHTTKVMSICFNAITSLNDSEHHEIVEDLIAILAWKNKSLALQYNLLNDIILETMPCTPSHGFSGERFNSARVGINNYKGNREIWVSNLFERSYACGNEYEDNYYNHKISKLAIMVFHLTRHIKSFSGLLGAGIYETCVKLRAVNNDMLNLEMSIAFSKAYQKSSTALLRDSECKWAEPTTRDYQPFHGYCGSKLINTFGNCRENTTRQIAMNAILQFHRADQIALIKRVYKMHKLYILPEP
jgi:hypothetical protein